jgi:hypothetical protein
MSMSQVYQQFTKYMVNKYRTLDTLCALNTYTCIVIDAPTWMPDWREHPVARPEPHDNFDYLSMDFAPAGETLVEMQDPLTWGNLQVTGCRIDQVKSLLTFSTSVYGITRVHEVLEDGTDTEHEYADNIDRALELGNKEDPDIIKAFAYGPNHSNRCCHTVASRVFLVARWTRVGDDIWILQGARLPFVLRSGCQRERQVHEQSLRKVFYEVVRPCCAPDLMDGNFYNHFFGQSDPDTTKNEEDKPKDSPILQKLTLV